MSRPPVDIAWFTRVWILCGGLALTAFGGAAIGAAVAGLTTDSAVAERVVVGLLGGIFLLAGIALLGWRIAAPPRMVLEVDDAALRASGRRGVDWSLAWRDIARLELVRTRGRYRAVPGSAGGSFGYIRLPRHYLLVHLHRGAARPEVLASPGTPRVDLGVWPSTARAVADALAGRLDAPLPRRLDRAETDRVLA
jgi:hypothetical protein